ncbi:MAG: hypothetical protein ACFFD1_12605 [Candidatus Thorarchaeota archaeon]
MKIKYRHYQQVEDLELQTSIWLKATKNLPWAWKPNKTQYWYVRRSNFDPYSKLFAFDNDLPIGYMSCIRRDNFTPMGFPWILDGYEGEIQEYLFDTVYNHAVKEFKSRNFLQRFRKEWKYQIDFLERKNFHLERSNPIFIMELNKNKPFSLSSKYKVKIHNVLPELNFFKLVNNDPNYKNEEKNSMKSYLMDDLNIDFYLEVVKDSVPCAMISVTIREDTGYSEINLLTMDEKYPETINIALESMINKLISRNLKFLSMTVAPHSKEINLLENYGFKLRSESVFYSKQISK